MYGIVFGLLVVASALTTVAKGIVWLMGLLCRKM